MNICRNRLWTLVVRLPKPLGELTGQSIRINSVIAHKWHSIASASNQKSIDLVRWPQLSTFKINEPFVAYISSSRNVHLHKRDIKYEEKITENDTKPEKRAPDEKEVVQCAKPDSKISEGKEVPSATSTKAESSDDVLATDSEKKLGLFARFKLMSKQYWYVLLPVHVVTSCFWFGGLYYLSSR